MKTKHGDGDAWNYVWAHEKKQEKWIKKLSKAIPEKAWQRTLGEGVSREYNLLYCPLGMVIQQNDFRFGRWAGDQVL